MDKEWEWEQWNAMSLMKRECKRAYIPLPHVVGARLQVMRAIPQPRRQILMDPPYLWIHFR